MSGLPSRPDGVPDDIAALSGTGPSRWLVDEVCTLVDHADLWGLCPDRVGAFRGRVRFATDAVSLVADAVAVCDHVALTAVGAGERGAFAHAASVAGRVARLAG